MESGLLQTLLGALLATFGGGVVLWFERLGNREDARKAKVEQQSAQLLAIILNLQQMHAWNRVIAKSIDECFDSAVDPAGTMDPGLKVLPMVMPAIAPRQFTSEELGFVFSTGDSGLIEKILSVSTNFFANLQTLHEFNLMRREHMDFVRSEALSGAFQDGQFANVSLPSSTLHRHESYVVVLNQLVGTLMESTARDADDCVETLTRLLTAAKSIHGLSVPKVTFPVSRK